MKMTIEERQKKLAYAEKMEASTAKRIFRLNTALKGWRRRVKMHQQELAKQEKAVLSKRIQELEKVVSRPGKRAIDLDRTESAL